MANLATINNNLLADSGIDPIDVVTGSGIAGQVAFWSGTTTQAGSNNLFWDNVNGRLGIKNAAPTYTLSLNGGISLTNDGGIGILWQSGSAFRSSGTIYMDYGQGGTGDLVFRGGSSLVNVAIFYNNGIINLAANGQSVGIQQPTPVTRLDVNGALAVSGPLAAHTTNRGIFEYNGDKVAIRAYGATAGTGFIAFNTGGGGGTADSEKMRLTATGNLLVGSTADTTERLQITGTSKFTDSATFTKVYSNTSDLGVIISATIPGINLRTASSGRISLISNYNSANSATIVTGTGTNNPTSVQMFFDFTNLRVGIGTTTPNTRLDVNGAASIAGGTEGLRIGNVGDNSSYDNVKIYYTGFNAGAPRVYLTPRTTPGSGIVESFFHIQNSNGSSTTSNNTMGLLVDGSVGIGNIAPTQKLHVTGSIRVTGAYYDSNNSAGTVGQVLSATATGTDWVTLSEIAGVDGTGTANYIAKWLDANTITDSLLFDNGTNVGIGTTSPISKLSVRGVGDATGVTLTLENGGSILAQNDPLGIIDFYSNDISVGAAGVRGSISLRNEFGGHWDGNPIRENTYFSFSTSSNRVVSERVRITSLGYVGIGTTAPSSLLHISGGAATLQVTDTAKTAVNTLSIYALSQTSWAIATGTSGTLGTQRITITDDGYIGLGTNTPTSRLYVTLPGINTTFDSGTATDARLEFRRAGVRIGYLNWDSGVVTLQADSGNYLSFNAGGSERVRITAAGDVGIGTTAPAARLHVVGGGNTSATTALTVQNSASTNMWRFLNDGQLLLGSNASGAVIHPSGTDGVLNIGGLNATFYTSVTTQAFGTGAFHFWGTTLQSTSGFNTQVSITRQFAPTSGTAQMYYLSINPTINQTGGASGITRGLFVGPTLTAAADWRSIEWSNNTGWGLYGSGTAANYLAGTLSIGTTANDSGYLRNYATIPVLALQNPTTGTATTDGFQLSISGSLAYIWQYENSAMLFGTNATERMRITATGDVGIGTSAPNVKLDVNGTLDLRNAFQGYARLAPSAGNGSQARLTIRLKPVDTAEVVMASLVQDGSVGLGGNITDIISMAGSFLSIASNGQTRLRNYGVGTFTGTVAYNLAVDASGNIIETAGGVVDGSGTANYISKWQDANTLTNSLLFDNGTNVGIGTNTPQVELAVYSAVTSRIHVQNLASGVSANDGFQFAISGSDGYLWNWENGNILFGTNGSERMRITATGNLLIGSTADTGAGQRLQVTGNAYLSGNLSVLNGFTISSAGSNNLTGAQSTQAAAILRITNSISSFRLTAGTQSMVDIVNTFAPTSGPALHHLLNLEFTVNQTGGASGITRGIFLNAIITAAADFRAIEWTNNTGWGLYGAGTAPSYLGGDLLIGTTTEAYRQGNRAVISLTGVTDALMSFRGSGTSLGYIYASTGSFDINANSRPITFSTTGSERVRILNNGNVGIGTSAPSNKLEVIGSIYTNSTITSNTYSTPGTSLSPVFSDTINLGSGANLSKIQYGNEFSNTNGSYLRFIVNSASSISTPVNAITIKPSGLVQFNQYGSGTNTGTVAYNLAVDASGNVIETAGGVVDGSGTANYISKWQDANTLTNSLLQEGTNSIGLGVTPQAWEAVSRALQIGTTGSISSNTSDYRTTVAANAYIATSGAATYLVNAAASQYMQISGTHRWFYAASGTGAITFSEAMRITAAGDVGIGTTAPNEKLHVAGNIHAFASGGINASFLASTAAGTTNVWIRSSGVSHFNGGDVGIGTATPSYKLHVVGSFGALTSGVTLEYNSGILYHGGSYYQFPSGSYYNIYGRSGMGLIFGSNNAEAARFDLSGNLGIGTTAPNQKLQVAGFVNAQGYVNNGVTFRKSFYLGNIAAGATTPLGLLTFGSVFTKHFRVTITSYYGTKTVEFVGYQGNMNKATYGFAGGGGEVVVEAVLVSTNITAVKIGVTTAIQDFVYTATVECMSLFGSWVDYAAGEVITPSTIASTTTLFGLGGGNVGINTNNPLRTLHVNGGNGVRVAGYGLRNSTQSVNSGFIQVGGSDNLYGMLDFNAQDSNTIFEVSNTNANNNAELRLGGGFVSVRTGATPAERLRITSAGDVGIGTSAPGAKLDVNGASSLSTAIFTHSATDGGIDIRNTGTIAAIRSAQIRLTNGTTSFGANDRTYQLVNLGTGATTAAFTIQYWDGANYFERMRIRDDGNFGIGNSNPTQALVVQRNQNATTQILVQNSDVTNSSSRASVAALSGTVAVRMDAIGATTPGGYLGTTSNHPLYFWSNSTERMTITAAGDVGIGTTAPGARLEVVGISGTTLIRATVADTNGNADVDIRSTGTLGSSRLYFSDTAALSGSIIYNHSIDAMLFGANGTTDRMRLTSGGNLHVGPFTSDSGDRLQVVGNLRVSSASILLGNVTFGTQSLGTGMYWDNTNNRLGIGMSVPATQLHVRNATGSIITIESTNAGSVATPVETSINFNGYAAVLQAQISSQDRQANIVGGRLIFRVRDASNALQDRLSIDRNGAVRINAYGTGAITGTAAFNLAVDASGNIIETAGGVIDGSGTANYVPLWQDANTLTNSAIYQDASSNVVIGGTAVASSTFTVYGSALRTGGIGVRNSAGTYAGFVGNYAAGSGGGSTDMLIDSTGFIAFQTAASERMRLTSAGNLGIGTSAPTTSLVVRGNTSGYNKDIIVWERATDGAVQGTLGFGKPVTAGDENNIFVGSITNHPLLFITNNTEKLRVTTSGNLGIGSTNPSAYIDGALAKGIQIENAGRAGIRFFDNTGLVQNFDIGINAGTAFISAIYSQTPTIRYQAFGTHIFETNTTERMRITSAGNVGINTTNPVGRLDVVGTLVTARFLQTGSLSLIGTDTTASAQTILTLSTGVDNATGPNIILSKSRTQSNGSIVGGDVLGTIQFQGGDGTNSVESSRIQALSADVFSSTSRPSDLLFFTTATSSTTATERMRIRANGNVGIGDTGPSSRLQVGGDVRISGSGIAINGFSGGFLDFASGVFRIRAQETTGGAIAFMTAPNGLSNVSTERMRITPDGNVGIGTAAPTAPLDISTTTYFTTALLRTTQASNYLTLTNSGGQASVFSTGDALAFSTTGSVTERMRISATGNVGISTSTPTIKLQVENNENAGNGVFTRNTNSGTGAFSFFTTVSDAGQLQMSAHSSTHAVWANTAIITTTNGLTGGLSLLAAVGSLNLWTAGSLRMSVTSTGNVGIGTTSPVRKLHVNESSANTVGIALTNSSTTVNGLQLLVDGTGEASLWNYSNTALAFGTNNNERMRITATGLVGMGTTTPTAGYRLTLATGGMILTGTQATAGVTGAIDTQGYTMANANNQILNYFYANGVGNGFVTKLAAAIFRIQTSGVRYSTSTAYGIQVESAINGVSTDIATVYGIAIEDQTVGNVNNFGIWSNVSSAANRWNLYMVGTANNYMAGNLGIGTTTPGSRLTVSNATAGNLTAYIINGVTAASGNTGYGLAIESEATGVTSYALTVRNPAATNTYFHVSTATGIVGNVGIGTTTPGSRFSVELSGAANQRLANFRNTGGNSYIEIQSSGAGAVALWAAANNEFGIYQNTTAGTIGTAALYVNSTGNVGIGTTTPNPYSWASRTLTVSSSVTNSFAALEAYGNGTGAGALLLGNNTILRASIVGVDGSHLAFATNGNNTGSSQFERMRITSAGDVGIGTTAPANRLTVIGGLITAGTTTAQTAFLGADGSNVAYVGSLTNHAFQIRVNNTTRMAISTAGFVGIGTTTPAYLLDVSGTLGVTGASTFLSTITISRGQDANVTNLNINSGLTPVSAFQINTDQPNLLSIITSRNSYALALSTNDTERMRITSAGNVGVGTSSPNSRLEVNGSVSKSITTKTAAYTLTDSDYTVIGNTNLSAFTFTLPTAVGRTGRIYVIKNAVGGNILTVDANASETIDGYLTYQLQCQSGIIIQSDGANWHVISDIYDQSCLFPPN